MDQRPTTQLLWQSKTATAERHVTISADGLSMSLRTHEVTLSAEVEAPAGTAAIDCPDLELGAHVAQLRSLSWTSPAAPAAPASPPRRSLVLASPPRWIPEALEPA